MTDQARAEQFFRGYVWPIGGENLIAKLTTEFDAVRQECQPVWSPTPPTVPGWYWWREERPINPNTKMVMEIIDTPKGLACVYGIHRILLRDQEVSGEWAGPLPVPVEKEG